MSSKRVNGKQKGARGERDLVKRFANWYGSEFYRTPGSGSFSTRGFHSDVVNMSGDVVTTDPHFPFCVESKLYQDWRLEHLLFETANSKFHSWWEQTTRETPLGFIPLLCFRKNGSEWFMIIEKHHAAKIPGAQFATTMTVERLDESESTYDVVITRLANLFATDPDRWKK